MKASRILAAVALGALVIFGVGCKKSSFQGKVIYFTASSQATQTKTAYSDEIVGGYERIDWVSGDKIAIAMSNDGGEEVGDYLIDVVSTSGVKSQATLMPLGGPYGYNGLEWGEGEHSFSALYPSPSVDSNWPNSVGVGSLVLSYPAVQTLTPKGESGADALILQPDMKYAYMYAVAQEIAPNSTIDLSFTPLFTAFEISISAGDNDEVNLTGFRLISLADGEYPARTKDLYDDSNDADESASISVDLTGISLTRDGDPLVFTVFAYADNYSHLMLEFTGTEIGTRTLDLIDQTTGVGIPFEGMMKHRIYGLSFPKLDQGSAGGQGINWGGMGGEDLNWNGAEGEDINWGGNRRSALPGKFSVSLTKQVQFSRGNLVYKAGEFDFHKRQYDRCFTENCTAEFGPNTTFDLFGWATAGIAGADETMVNYQPWSFNDQDISGQEETNRFGFGPSLDSVPKEKSWDDYAEYCDWGNNYTLRQNWGEGWYTLSADEWAHMLYSRDASTVNGVHDARFAKAIVHGLNGLILFPDDFDYPGDDSIFTASSINNGSWSGISPFADLVLTDAQWSIAEKAGLVFLPPSGVRVYMDRVNITYYESGMTTDNFNLYWTSTADSKSNGKQIGSEGELFGCGAGTSRYIGLAVRLVKLAE